MQILMIAFSVYYVYLILNNKEKAFWLALFLILAIPFSRFNNIMSQIDVISIGGVSITLIHFMIICLFFRSIINNKQLKIRKSKISILMSLLFITYVIGLIVGIINGYDSIADGQKFILQIMWMSVLIYNIEIINIKKVLNITAKALSINFIIIIGMNIFQQKLGGIILQEFYESGIKNIDSYASNLAIFPIIFCFYDFICKRNISTNRNIYLCTVISIIYVLLFQNSRSIILIIVIVAFISCFFILKNSSKNTFLVKFIIIAILSILILSIAGIYLSSENELVQRLVNMDLGSKDDTLITRLNTIQYYYQEVKNNIFGYGFGKLIPLVNQYGRFHGEGSFYTDNAFVNIAMKCGVFSLILYISLILYPVKVQIKYYLKSKDNECIILVLCIVGFIILTTILTSQLNHNYVIMIGGWTYILCMLNKEVN